jgi:hypothetical protein
VDTGTKNSRLRSDPLHLGHRNEKISFEEEQKLLGELMETLGRRWPTILIQFEDWKNPFHHWHVIRQNTPCLMTMCKEPVRIS